MNIEERITRYVSEINPERLDLIGTIKDLRVVGKFSGESNKVFFLEANNRHYLVKINGVGGKDRDFFRKEFVKLKALEPYSVAPRAFIYDESALGGQSMILERVEGRTLVSDEVPKYLNQIIIILNSLARVPIENLRENEGFRRNISGCFEYVQIFPQHALKQLEEYARRFGQDDTYRLVINANSNAFKLIERKKGSFDNSEMGLIHTGLHSENIVLNPEEGIRLIDWEHSGIGDRAFEVSSLFRSNNLSQEQQRRVYSEYTGKTEAFEERVGIYTEVFKVHEVLWHAIRYDKARNGQINLDAARTPKYYQDKLQSHIQRLRESELARS